MFLYTIGVQGSEIEAILDQLTAANVGLFLDVRRLACCGARLGSSSVALRKGLSTVGISYFHFPKAGHPSASVDCLSKYEKYLQANRPILWDLLSQIRRASERGQTVCLACYKKIAAECHRSLLVDALVKMDPELHAINLPMDFDLPQISSIGLSSSATNRI